MKKAEAEALVRDRTFARAIMRQNFRFASGRCDHQRLVRSESAIFFDLSNVRVRVWHWECDNCPAAMESRQR